MPRRLSDISRLVQMHLRYYGACMAARDIRGAWSALNALNLTMPPEPADGPDGKLGLRKYQVVINDTIYHAVNRQANVAKCPVCNKKVEYEKEQESVRFLTDAELDSRGVLIRSTVNRSMPVWTCPECDAQSDMLDLNGEEQIAIGKNEPVLPNPKGVLPRLPEEPQTTELMATETWERDMAKWLHIAYGEINAKVAVYRRDMIEMGAMAEEGVFGQGEEYEEKE